MGASSALAYDVASCRSWRVEYLHVKRLTVLWTGWLALVAAGPPAPTDTGGDTVEMKTLWEIGSPGPVAGEFALGLDGFHLYPSRFPSGPLYVVGRSNSAHDWAPVQPGPRDAWAGSRRHTFTVRFGLDESNAGAACRLIIDLADAHLRTPPKLGIRINDFVRECQTDSGSANAVELRPPGGHPQRIVVDVPGSALRRGDNTLTITTLTGAWLVYDQVAWEAPAGTESSAVRPATRILSVRTRPVILRRPDGSQHQQARVFVEHAGDPARAMVGIEGEQAAPRPLVPGRQNVDVPVPLVEATTPATVTLRIDEQTVATQRFDLQPVRPWVVCLLHHTHLDIGYTHVQTQVETLQWSHLEKAIELGRATVQYPEAARFRWNPEGLWAVESYLDQASPAQRALLIDAVKQGSIGLDALYGNALTGLCRPEELFQLTASARRLSQKHGLVIDSAMISDIPGFTWGLVPALAHSGVKYLSIAPNRGHRIGYALSEWGDKPFYWSSPSGEQRVLCWMAGKGYSWFHGAWRGADTFTYDHVDTALDGAKILSYLDELEQRGYPYDLVQLRYNIGSDNGPPRTARLSASRHHDDHGHVPGAGGALRRRAAGLQRRLHAVLGGWRRLVCARDCDEPRGGRAAGPGRGAVDAARSGGLPGGRLPGGVAGGPAVRRAHVGILEQHQRAGRRVHAPPMGDQAGVRAGGVAERRGAARGGVRSGFLRWRPRGRRDGVQHLLVAAPRRGRAAVELGPGRRPRPRHKR
jgi:hypothetical protein